MRDVFIDLNNMIKQTTNVFLSLMHTMKMCYNKNFYPTYNAYKFLNHKNMVHKHVCGYGYIPVMNKHMPYFRRAYK